MIEDRLKKTAVLTAIFAVLSLGFMLYRAGTKNIIIVEATKEQAGVVNLDETYKLQITKPSDAKGKGSLVIPLEQGVGSDDITFEENYSEHKFMLYISGKTLDFYASHSAISDLEFIKSGQWSRTDDRGGVCLEFDLDGLYENETALGDNEITVMFKTPGELYENIVVIDPVDATGISLVPHIKKYLDKEENIRAYYTRQSADAAIDAAAEALMKDSAANFYIQIGADSAESNVRGAKTYYNDRFFIREFGNVQLSDKLERNLALTAGMEALGLFASDESNSDLMNSEIPSAFVTIGNMQNEEDAKLLSQDSYLEKCADGIVNGIKEAFETVNPSGKEENADALQGIINGN